MEKFIKFLEDNNAWENFERAFKNYRRDVKDYRRDIKDYKETCKAIENAELSSAFRWVATREGTEYWQKLEDKWIQENAPLKQQLLSDD